MKMVQPSCIHGHYLIPKCHISETLISIKVMLSSTWVLKCGCLLTFDIHIKKKPMLDISLPSQEHCFYPTWQMQRSSSMPPSHPGWTTVLQSSAGYLARTSRDYSTSRTWSQQPYLKISSSSSTVFFKDIPPVPPRSPHPPKPLKYHSDQIFSSPALGLWKSLPDNPRARQSMDTFKWNQKSYFKKTKTIFSSDLQWSP